VVLVEAEETVDLVGQPGQQVTTVLMAEVLRRPRRNLLIDPEIRSGNPVVSGTRVPFDLIAGLVRGVPLAKIADYLDRPPGLMPILLDEDMH
jgi:hypothetical protein